MTRDLFDAARREEQTKYAPLAARMRPSGLDEVVGQRHLVGPDAAFRRLVESGRPPSMLLWGPPGSGKTTLARLIARHADAHFETLSATSAGVKEVRKVVAEAERRLGEQGRRTVLFLDEIHRFSKSQQDALLPAVEEGTLVLIGATTENPFYELTAPLMSRLTLFRTERLTADQIGEIVDRALRDPRGLGGRGLTISEEAREWLAVRHGDARAALNVLEAAATLAEGRGSPTIDLDDVAEAAQQQVLTYDKSGDMHYDVASAFIKSLRGSDVDAALYWLHLMLQAGEDPEFVARRMIIFASEDVGLADPEALVQAVAAADALAYVGLPEAAYALTQATIYLASAPKSNSVARAMSAARRLVEEHPHPIVPVHLRDSSHSGVRELGHGQGYLYPHDHPGGVVRQEYFPGDPVVLYRPGDGDAWIAQRLEPADRILGRERH